MPNFFLSPTIHPLRGLSKTEIQFPSIIPSRKKEQKQKQKAEAKKGLKARPAIMQPHIQLFSSTHSATLSSQTLGSGLDEVS